MSYVRGILLILVAVCMALELIFNTYYFYGAGVALLLILGLEEISEARYGKEKVKK